MKRILLILLVLGFSFSAQIAQAQWTPAKRLTWNSGFSYFPTIAVDSSGNLHVVWQDDTPGNPEIFYKKGTDAGSVWAASKRLTMTSGDSGLPVIAADSGGSLNVVWVDNTPGNSEIFFKKSTDAGAAWTTGKRLTWTSGYSENPAMVVDQSPDLHVVWTDVSAGNDEIFYKKSTDGGISWTVNKRLTWTSGYSWTPAVAVDPSNNLHVVWRDDTPGNFEIFYKKSTDGGISWTANKRLTWTSGGSYRPAIASGLSGNLHVVWRDDTSGNWEIYYKKSADGGETWSSGKRLTVTSGDSVDPGIAVDTSGDLHVVWSCLIAGVGAHIDYMKSADGGNTWTSAQRLSWGSGLPSLPVIAIDSYDNLHVVFYVATGGNSEVYYKKYIK